MDAAIDSLLQHTNDDHQADLRMFVSLRCDIPENRLAGVRLDRPSPDGLVLHWVDARGGHSRWLAFGSHARTAGEFAALLRAELMATLPGGADC
jgi:hypothetical protein